MSQLQISNITQNQPIIIIHQEILSQGLKNQIPKISLKQLAARYKKIPIQRILQQIKNQQSQLSLQQKQFIKLLLFTHQTTISHIKNQSALLKQIFTYQNTKLLISFLTQEHPNIYKDQDNAKAQVNELQSQSLQIIGISRFRDIAQQQYPLQFTLPYVAKQIFSSECHHINELLFEGLTSKQENGQIKTIKKPLIYELLKFLDYKEHYLLAGYFSKVILSITKRVFSSNHKYNFKFCKAIFETGQGQIQINNSSLGQTYFFKTINHLYSSSSIQYIIKWMNLTSIVEESQKNSIDLRKQIKQAYIFKLVQIINKKSYKKQILINIVDIFDQLFTPNSTANAPGSNLKLPFELSIIPTKKSNKFSPYQLATETKALKSIMEPILYTKLSASKIKLLTLLIVKYKGQFSKLKQMQQKKQQKSLQNKSSDQNSNLNIFNRIEVQDIQQLLIWVFLAIKMILTSKNDSLNPFQFTDQSEAKEQILIKSKQGFFIPSYNKVKKYRMILLNLLDLLWQIHTIQIIQPFVIDYYNENKQQIIQIVVSIMKQESNIIQLAQSKLIRFVLTGNKLSGTNLTKDIQQQNINIKNIQLWMKKIAFQFGKKLLFDGISQLIDIKNVREHLIPWAQIILNWQNQRIFQNQQQQHDWEHMHEIVSNMKSISIGQSQHNPGQLRTFYSKQKAQLVYSKFVLDFNCCVQYENKQNDKRQIISKQKISQQQIKFQQKQRIQNKNKSIQRIVYNLDNIKPIPDFVNYSSTFEFEQYQNIQYPLLIEPLKNGYLQFDLQKLINDLQFQ